MAYTEIVGRTHKKVSGSIVYLTLGVCAAETEAPKLGAALSDPDLAHTQDAVCVAANVDEKRYPGRFFVASAWDAPLLRSEITTF